MDRGFKFRNGLKRIAASMACHAAVKANYPLTMEKMLRITKRELERNFAQG